MAINLIRLECTFSMPACCCERERNKRRSEPVVKLFSDDEMTSFVSGSAVLLEEILDDIQVVVSAVFLCCSFFVILGFSSLAKINFAHTQSHTRLNVLLLFLLSVPIFASLSLLSCKFVCAEQTTTDRLRTHSLTHSYEIAYTYTLTTNRLSYFHANLLLIGFCKFFS